MNGRPTADLAPVTKRQARILQRLAVSGAGGVARTPISETPFDAALDGLVGYGLKGAPRGTAAELIHWANRQPAPIIALDIPSGVDASFGFVHDPAIKACATMTLALPKTGMLFPWAREWVGELYVADIGVPPELYARAELGFPQGPLFAREDVVRLW